MCILKDSLSAVRNGRTPGKWIADHIKAELDAFFASDSEFQERSAIRQRNRIVDRDASAYTGGSISSGEHLQRTSDQDGRPPNAIDILQKTKKLKSRVWANDKSR